MKWQILKQTVEGESDEKHIEVCCGLSGKIVKLSLLEVPEECSLPKLDMEFVKRLVEKITFNDKCEKILKELV